MATAISSFKGSGGTKQASVKAAVYGDMLKLSFEDTGKYAGLIKNAAFARLLETFTVTLAAKLTAPSSVGNAISRKKNLKIDLPQDCEVRIVVYGLLAEKQAVGNILGDSGLYLQHPCATECDPMVSYHNPHYLLRPGAQMPAPYEPDVGNSGELVENEPLDEINKGRFMRMFDEFGNSTGDAQMKPSGRLRSTLKE